MMGFIVLTFEFIVFLLAIYFYFYIPGKYILSYSKQPLVYPTNIFLSIITGVIFFTLAVYILSWLHVPFLIFLLIFIVVYLSYKKNLLVFPKIPKEHRKASIFTLMLAGVFSLQMILNGNFNNSIYYFGDDMAHLGYISELRFAFPPQHPGFAGVPLKGYHFFYDFLIANISRASFLSPFSLYFHFMPLFVAFGWAFGSYALLSLWTKKISAAMWGVFFVLFGSSFGYILFFQHHPGISLRSDLGINQPETALLNAPYSFSVVILLATILFMHLYLKKRDKILLFILAVIVGITPMFKVYAGMISIVGFGALVIYELLKRNAFVLYACAVSGGVLLATFGVFAGSGASLFYLPLWPIERMFDQLFPEYGYKEKIDTYTKYSVISGLFSTHLHTFSVFLLGNLGTRCIGILFLPLILLKTKRFPSVFACIVFLMMCASVGVPLLFAQTIKVFDMIQMTWYYPVFGALFAAIGVSYFLSLHLPKIVKVSVAVLIIFFTLIPQYYIIPTNILPFFSLSRQPFSSEYFQAMNYLKTHGAYTDTVMHLPIDPSYTEVKNLKNWFNSSNPHIAAFGEKRMYLGNQYIVFPNMPVEERLAFLAKINKIEFAKKRDPKMIDKIIKEIKKRKISYIYSAIPVHSFTKNTSLPIVFKNSSAIIYEVK